MPEQQTSLVHKFVHCAGCVIILAVDLVAKVQLWPMSDPTVLVTNPPVQLIFQIFWSFKGEDNCDASDTTSGGFSSASSCEEQSLSDSPVSSE